MKTFRYMMTLAMVGLLTTAINAQEGEKCTQCPSSKSATSVAVQQEGSCNGCADEFVGLPKMTYKIGDKETCCSESAASMAKKMEKPVHYVVGTKTFEKENEAFVSLVEQTEAQVKAFVTPAKCEKSGTTTIAGAKCSCPVDAGKKAEMVKNAVATVKMSYVVGKEKCGCPNQAATMAKKSGEKTTYVVAGKETCCQMTARLNLARAQYAAATKAIAAKKPAKTDSKG